MYIQIIPECPAFGRPYLLGLTSTGELYRLEIKENNTIKETFLSLNQKANGSKSQMKG